MKTPERESLWIQGSYETQLWQHSLVPIELAEKNDHTKERAHEHKVATKPNLAKSLVPIVGLGKKSECTIERVERELINTR